MGVDVKIYNRTDFLKLPENTIFVKGARCYFIGDMCIKGETWGNDFLYSSLYNFDADDSGNWANKFDDALENGTSLEADFEIAQRDGLYEDDAVFLVYEKEDIKKLIELFNGVLNDNN